MYTSQNLLIFLPISLFLTNLMFISAKLTTRRYHYEDPADKAEACDHFYKTFMQPLFARNFRPSQKMIEVCQVLFKNEARSTTYSTISVHCGLRVGSECIGKNNEEKAFVVSDVLKGSGSEWEKTQDMTCATGNCEGGKCSNKDKGGNEVSPVGLETRTVYDHYGKLIRDDKNFTHNIFEDDVPQETRFTGGVEGHVKPAKAHSIFQSNTLNLIITTLFTAQLAIIHYF